MMLDSAKVSQGTRFFDAGCGGGSASILAAQRGAHISGLDASKALIAIARSVFTTDLLDLLLWGHQLWDA